MGAVDCPDQYRLEIALGLLPSATNSSVPSDSIHYSYGAIPGRKPHFF